MENLAKLRATDQSKNDNEENKIGFEALTHDQKSLFDPKDYLQVEEDPRGRV